MSFRNCEIEQQAMSSTTVLLPYSVGLDYVVLPTGAADVAIAGKDFRAERLGLLPSLWAQVALALLFQEEEIPEMR